jgi:hypothetical protein
MLLAPRRLEHDGIERRVTRKWSARSWACRSRCTAAIASTFEWP